MFLFSFYLVSQRFDYLSEPWTKHFILPVDYADQPLDDLIQIARTSCAAGVDSAHLRQMYVHLAAQKPIMAIFLPQARDTLIDIL